MNESACLRIWQNIDSHSYSEYLEFHTVKCVISFQPKRKIFSIATTARILYTGSWRCRIQISWVWYQPLSGSWCGNLQEKIPQSPRRREGCIYLGAKSANLQIQMLSNLTSWFSSQWHLSRAWRPHNVNYHFGVDAVSLINAYRTCTFLIVRYF